MSVRNPLVDEAIRLVRNGWMPRLAAEEVGASYPTVRSRLAVMERKGETVGWYEAKHKKANKSRSARDRGCNRPKGRKFKPNEKRWAPIDPWRVA